MKINRKQLRQMIREALTIKEGESERMAARLANRTRMLDGSGRTSPYGRGPKPATGRHATKVLSTAARAQIAATVAVVAAQVAVAVREGHFAFKAADEAHERANKNMARSLINRSWNNSLKRRKSQGEKSDRGLLKKHIDVMQDFRAARDFDTDTFAEALSFIAKEEWERLEEDPSGYGNTGAAIDVFRKMVGDSRERALTLRDFYTRDIGRTIRGGRKSDS